PGKQSRILADLRYAGAVDGADELYARRARDDANQRPPHLAGRADHHDPHVGHLSPRPGLEPDIAGAQERSKRPRPKEPLETWARGLPTCSSALDHRWSGGATPPLECPTRGGASTPSAS